MEERLNVILQCCACSKVRKFGEWVDVPAGLGEVIQEVKVIKTHCPQCHGDLLSIPSLGQVVLKRVRTGVVNRV